jgi:hypothetical protein
MGTEDRKGEVPSLGPAMLNFFVGKSSDLRPKEAFENKSFEINERKRNAAKLVTSLSKRRGPVSEKELTDAYNQANEAYYNVLSDAHRLYNDQITLGTPKRELLNYMKEARLSADDIRQITRGYIEPYELSENTLREIPRDRARLLTKLARQQRRLARERYVLRNPKGTNKKPAQ